LRRMSSTPAIEIEQKFAMSDGGAIERRLADIGLRKESESVICDWYFDLAEPVLSPNDYWIRFREMKGKSAWQLKVGRHHESGTTIYEEIEGIKAFQTAMRSFPQIATGDTNGEAEFEGHTVPKPLVPCNLCPFARIETTRSSWFNPDKKESITVDLDCTSHGYAVGEVETIVHSQEEIPWGQEKVRAFLRDFLPDTDDSSLPTPVIGKLEDYLMRCRPDHYEACVRGGSIRR